MLKRTAIFSAIFAFSCTLLSAQDSQTVQDENEIVTQEIPLACDCEENPINSETPGKFACNEDEKSQEAVTEIEEILTCNEDEKSQEPLAEIEQAMACNEDEKSQEAVAEIEEILACDCDEASSSRSHRTLLAWGDRWSDHEPDADEKREMREQGYGDDNDDYGDEFRTAFCKNC